jgi:hypothetical protein
MGPFLSLRSAVASRPKKAHFSVCAESTYEVPPLLASFRLGL